MRAVGFVEGGVNFDETVFVMLKPAVKLALSEYLSPVGRIADVDDNGVGGVVEKIGKNSSNSRWNLQINRRLSVHWIIDQNDRKFVSEIRKNGTFAKQIRRWLKYNLVRNLIDSLESVAIFGAPNKPELIVRR